MSSQASTTNYLQLYFRFACAFSILAVVCTLNCRFPCNPARCPDEGPCAHGTVKDQCACCDVCAKGLGESCGGPYNGFGRCGVGLVCNINMTIHIGLRPIGECIREERTMNTSRNVTNHNNMTGLNATNATNPDGSDCITNATNVTTSSNVTTSTRGCREKCSIQFCSERARICSARGLEYSKVQARNDCQHTSCRACFMVIKPNCTRCPEPPNKKCLRRYYECVELHYTFGDVLLRLGDPTIHTVEGELLCHVPDVGEYSEDSTSH